jgi:hypothetical protein
MTTEFNYDDWMNAFHAWEVFDRLLAAKGYSQMVEAMQGVTPEIRDRLLDVVSKLRMAVPTEEEALPVRRLRFPRKDREFTNLMNIACYRYVVDDEARILRGERDRPAIPYGVTDTASLRMKIENYRWAYTHMARGYGIPEKQYATHTIRLLIEFGASEHELDEAAAYYMANPE